MRKIHYLTFDATELPVSNRIDDISSHESKSGIIETAGGYIDGYTSYAPVEAKEITITADIVGKDAYELDEKVETWKAKVAKKAKLHRRIGHTIQWVWARLMSVSAETDYKGPQTICEIEMSFEIISAYWYGNPAVAWYLDDGNFLDSGLYLNADAVYEITEVPTLIEMVNHGNVQTNEITLRIWNPTRSTLPAGLQIKTGACNLYINRQIQPSEVVEIYIPKKLARVATYDGDPENPTSSWTSIYKQIVTDAGHTDRSWLSLQPGTNMVTIAAPSWVTAHPFYLHFDYVDKWR